MIRRTRAQIVSDLEGVFAAPGSSVDVFVVDTQKVAHRKTVEAGPAVDGKMQVLSGLAVGEAPACVQGCPNAAIRIVTVRPEAVRNSYRPARLDPSAALRAD